MDRYIFTEHALFEMQRRGLSKETVEEVIKSPEQQWYVKKGRIVLQSRFLWKLLKSCILCEFLLT